MLLASKSYVPHEVKHVLILKALCHKQMLQYATKSHLQEAVCVMVQHLHVAKIAFTQTEQLLLDRRVDMVADKWLRKTAYLSWEQSHSMKVFMV